jgi:hypothetical protein
LDDSREPTIKSPERAARKIGNVHSLDCADSLEHRQVGSKQEPHHQIQAAKREEEVEAKNREKVQAAAIAKKKHEEEEAASAASLIRMEKHEKETNRSPSEIPFTCSHVMNVTAAIEEQYQESRRKLESTRKKEEEEAIAAKKKKEREKADVMRRSEVLQVPPKIPHVQENKKSVERQVELTIKCARHLPKMDLMGTCDAFCEIEWQGKKQKTTVKKNSYSPDWDETFSFSFDDISGAVSDLSVVVMDWDMLTKADLVGKVVIPADTLKSFLQHEQNVTREGSYPVLNEGKAVTGNDKQPCVINLKMCLLVPNEKPLPTVTASLQEQNQRREMEAARKLAEETQREAEEVRRKRELMEARRKIEEEQALNEKKRQEEESRKDEERHEQEKMRKAAAAKKKEEQDKAAAAKKEEEDKAAEKAAVAKKKEVDKAAAKAAAEKAASEAKVVILANIRRCLCVSGKI